MKDIFIGTLLGIVLFSVALLFIPKSKPLECPKIEVQQGKDIQTPEFQLEYQARDLETHF